MISLIGLPGSGKSTVGRQLARRLQVPFFDSDRLIEQRLGCSIREFFQRAGEAQFRDLESAVMAELTQRPMGVLSSGGGAVLRPTNRQMLRLCGYVVYLNASPEDLFSRLRYDRKRPLLQVEDPLAKLRDLYLQRDPLYRETAHLIVRTGQSSVAKLVHYIEGQLSRQHLPQEGAKCAAEPPGQTLRTAVDNSA